MPEEERLIRLPRSSQTLRKNVIKASKIGSEMNLLTNILQKHKNKNMFKEKLRHEAAWTCHSLIISILI